MFAHTISPPPSATYHRLSGGLSVALGISLSCLAMSVQAANSDTVISANALPQVAADDTVIESPQVTYARLKNPNAPIDPSTLASDAVVMQQTKLFFECTQVKTDAARLACFDKVAERGEVPSYTTTKQPLNLAKTLKTTLLGNPQVVLDETTDPALLSQTSTSNELDTVGLTKSEAQVLEDVGVTQTDIEKYTPLSLAYDLDKNSERGTWTARPHRPMYVLPLFLNLKPNRNPNTPSQEEEPFTPGELRVPELKLQVSIKSKVAEDLFDTNADLWFGYTQQSHWQVYNEDNSRPFRATDYEPEIFLTQPVTADLPFGGRLRMLGVGASHHSNGQDDPLSRSWNRVYLMGGAEWGKFAILPRLWARVGEDSDDDDNPDIEDFMGYGDLTFLYNLPKQQTLSGTLRYNPSTEKGAAQIDYIYPLTDNLNGYLQLFHGYGESIVDYNHENTAIGVGIMLNDWKGL